MIRQASPIEDIASNYVRLRKIGQNLTGLCPFHPEKTPSFSVHPAKQLFHCFGCGAGGDVFTFVARIERTGFLGAVRHLALRAGIRLDASAPEEAERTRRERERRERAAGAVAEADLTALAAARENLRLLLALKRNAQKRLAALNGGAKPRSANETESCWQALRIVGDELPSADAAYCIAAFAAPKERYGFGLHPEQRAAMVDAALEVGYVANERGYRFEVPA